MKKKVLSIIVFFCLFLPMPAACPQEQDIMNDEWQIYDEYKESLTRLLNESSEERQKVQEEIEEKYGISGDGYIGIMMKRDLYQEFGPSEVTPQEKEILDYYNKRMEDIDAERETKLEEAIEEIADSEGMSVDNLKALIVKCSERDPTYPLDRY